MGISRGALSGQGFPVLGTEAFAGLHLGEEVGIASSHGSEVGNQIVMTRHGSDKGMPS